MSEPSLWSISLCLQAHSLWQSTDPAPSLAYIPAMSRRRLSPLARMALHVAQAVSEVATDQPQRMVFASRHGEINSTTQMLHDLAQGVSVSPAAFSHSVHNAIPGLWSIFQQQHGECASIAAGLDSLPIALLEAATLLASDASSPVLTLIADEVPPACFSAYLDELAEPYALALLLKQGKPNLRLSAMNGDSQSAVCLSDTGASRPPARPAALTWHDWWLGEQQAPLEVRGERHHWRWEKC